MFGVNQPFKTEIDLFILIDGGEYCDGPEFKNEGLFYDLSAIEVGGSGPNTTEDCRVIATLKPDFSPINKSTLPKHLSPVGEYYKVNYDIEIGFETMLSFRLRYQGRMIPFLVSLSDDLGVRQGVLKKATTTGEILGTVTADYSNRPGMAGTAIGGV